MMDLPNIRTWKITKPLKSGNPSVSLNKSHQKLSLLKAKEPGTWPCPEDDQH